MNAWDNLPDDVSNGDPRAPWNEADEDEEEGAEREEWQEWGGRGAACDLLLFSRDVASSTNA